jgi:hypothetical protein
MISFVPKFHLMNNLQETLCVFEEEEEEKKIIIIIMPALLPATSARWVNQLAVVDTPTSHSYQQDQILS